MAVAKPHLFTVVFYIGPIPVKVGFNLPIVAGLNLSATVAGTVNYNGTHVATGSFDYTCTKSNCTGSSNFDNTPVNGSNQSITGGVDGRVKPTPWLDVGFRAYLYTESVAYAQVGVRPHLLGDLWGYTGNNCGDAAGDGHHETVRALTFDLDRRIDLTAKASVLGSSPWERTIKTGSVKHMAFWDLINSSAMQPYFQGPGSLFVDDPGAYKVRMRPCWPYTDNVTYQLNWGDGAAAQELTGAPATELTANHTWTAAGSKAASFTAARDAHGRTIHQGTPRTIEVKAITPLSVTVTQAPLSVTYGNPVVLTATATGGHTPTIQYTLGRRRVGTADWLPVPLAWQTNNVLSWPTTAADAGSWELAVGVKDRTTAPDANGLGYAAAAMAGTVQIVAPLTLSCPAAANRTVTQDTATSWTVSSAGGTPGTIQFTLSRNPVGTTNYASLAWQPGNLLSWTPTAANLGTWQVSALIRDVNTPASPVYTAYCNLGQVTVVAPLSLTATVSPSQAAYGNPFTWTATAGGGTPSTTRFAFFRRRSGTTAWMPDVNTPSWQAGNTFTWTPTLADAGNWDTYVWVKDGNTPANANTYGYAAGANTGGVQVKTQPLTLTGTASPSSSYHGVTLNWTATAGGGTPATTRYAFFRRRAGTTPWTPDVTAPAWQTGNVLSWTPASADVGTWEIIIWVKDGDTPATMNTHGFAAYYNAGPVQVVAPPTLTVNMSPGLVSAGTPVTWTASATSSNPSSLRYAFFRRRSGATAWIPAATSPSWQTSNTFTWTPSAADAGNWDTYVWVKDGITPASPGYGATCNPGNIQVLTPLTVTGTGSPSSSPYGATITWTATASGGDPSTIRYAFFRRLSGTSSWTPDVTAPNWQSSRTMSWTPTSADVGTWEIFIWVKDANTPPTMNTYGHAAWYNAGPVQVTAPAPLTVSGTGSPSTSPAGTTITWTATASGGIPSTVRYALFRRKAGTSNWIPDVTAPNWQTSRTLSWTPGASDVGTWEIIVWVKDVNTSPTQNGYGFAAYYNAQPVQVY